jgi:hypothetical protein
MIKPGGSKGSPWTKKEDPFHRKDHQKNCHLQKEPPPYLSGGESKELYQKDTKKEWGSKRGSQSRENPCKKAGKRERRLTPVQIGKYPSKQPECVRTIQVGRRKDKRRK